MLRVFATGLLFICTSPVAAQTLYSFGIDKTYSVTISRDALEDSPRWGKDEDNPPISAKKAIANATRLKDSLVKDTEDWTWKLESAGLKPARDERWFWLITFQAEFDGMLAGLPPFLHLVVLMDGTVIKRKVSDRLLGVGMGNDPLPGE